LTTNAIMLCGVSEPWLHTLELMRQEMNVYPVYYIAWEKDLKESELKEKFPDCFYQTIDLNLRNV